MAERPTDDMEHLHQTVSYFANILKENGIWSDHCEKMYRRIFPETSRVPTSVRKPQRVEDE